MIQIVKNYASPLTGMQSGAYIRVPSTYSSTNGKKYPVLIFLPGDGEKSNWGSNVPHPNLINVALPKIIEAGTLPACMADMIIVTPFRNTGDWDYPTPGGIAKELATTLIPSWYNIDPNRIYITGLSGGGSGCWTAIQKHRNIFAAAIPMASWSNYPNEHANWVTPLRVFHNLNDSTIGIGGEQQMVSTLKSTYPSVDIIGEWPSSSSHDCWTYAYNKVSLWEWLVTKGLNGSVTPPIPAVIPQNIPGLIEAESCNVINGAQVVWGEVGYVNPGAYMDYVVNVTKTANYEIRMELAVAGTSSIEIQNAANGAILATLPLAFTGGYSSYASFSTSLPLTAGTQTIRVFAKGNGWNFNHMTFTEITAPPVTQIAAPATINLPAGSTCAIGGTTHTGPKTIQVG